MLRIAICDDEQFFQIKIRKLISEYLRKKHIECEIVCFESGEQLLDSIESDLTYEIIFLDVNMKEINGIKTAERIRIISSKVSIVFVTAFITYAIEGYRVEAFRYLLKTDANFSVAMKECLDTIIARMNYVEPWQEFDFQSGKKELSLDRILYIESCLHKTIFYVLENGIKEYSMYEKLDSVQKKLPDAMFCRTHQSYIVNMRYARKVERYKVTLCEDTKVSISKKYYKEVDQKYIRQKGVL